MKKEYHKIKGSSIVDVELSTAYGAEVHLVSRDLGICNSENSHAFRIKMDLDRLLEILQNKNIILHIRKARTWWHVEEIEVK